MTGWVSFGIGTGWVQLANILHASLGLGILVLVPWKSMIVRDGLRRHPGGGGTSLALLFIVVVTIVSGVLFSIGGVRGYGPLTAIQVHVGSGVLALALIIVHTVQRPVRPRRLDLERRNLIRTGGVLGIAGIAYLGLEGLAATLRLPGRDRRVTGSYERGSGNPAAMPVTSWINDTTPSIDTESWRLRVGPTALSLDDLSGFDDELTAILDCTGGWFAEQTWRGVRLDRLLDTTGSSSIVVRSATGYERRFPVADAQHLLVATHVAGEPLSGGHGFPARLVAPGRRGFWWVKWLTEIEASDRSWWLQPPFPLT